MLNVGRINFLPIDVINFINSFNSLTFSTFLRQTAYLLVEPQLEQDLERKIKQIFLIGIHFVQNSAV